MNLLLTVFGLRALLASRAGTALMMLPGFAWIAFGFVAGTPRLTVLNVFFGMTILLLAKRLKRAF